MTSIGSRPALLLAHRRQHRRLDLRAQALERHHAINHFQRIALRGNRRKPPVRIRESCRHSSDSHKFAKVAIFRGALKPIRLSVAPLTLVPLVLPSRLGHHDSCEHEGMLDRSAGDRMGASDSARANRGPIKKVGFRRTNLRILRPNVDRRTDRALLEPLSGRPQRTVVSKFNRL
jgi:hypothetical protein